MRMRRVIVMPYCAAAMYALVDDIESYPDFLPWCDSVEVKRQGESAQATLHIKYYGIQTALTTHNRHHPTSRIEMEFVAGALKSLSGFWSFVELRDDRCRVEFMLEYEFANSALEAIFGRLFNSIFGRFVDSFVEQARARYEEGKGAIICVTVAAADVGEKKLILPQTATVGDALEASGYANAESVGVFGRVCARQTPLSYGDRVEIYRPLSQDPRSRRRSRAEQ